MKLQMVPFCTESQQLNWKEQQINTYNKIGFILQSGKLRCMLMMTWLCKSFVRQRRALILSEAISRPSLHFAEGLP